MRDIVMELTKTCILRANILIKGWSNSRDLKIAPVAISIGACSVVISDNVIWVCDPDASRSLISVEKTPGTTHVNDQIVLNQVLRLSSIFNEDSVAHRVISYVVLDSEVVDTVNCDCTVEGVMDGIISHIRRVHCANHMEVNRVATKDEGLADIGELDAIDSCSSGFVSR